MEETAMNLGAVRHQGTFPDVYLRDRRTLIITLRTGRQDAEKCIIHYFARTTPELVKDQEMIFCGRDNLYDYYRVELQFHRVARYQKYYFEIVPKRSLCLDEKGDKEKPVYLSAYGIDEKRPADGFYEFLYANRTGIVDPPEWTKGQVFYQIFPERFADGNADNNPDGTMAWGSRPDRDNYMGGDLAGVREHLDYLESLGIDCIYLNPIFCGDFNHKYATTDYYHVDPQFGGDEEFAALVSRIHQKGMKIILDGVFNHCGIHFPYFQDVLQHQDQSRYKDWFYISSFPIDITHRDYECVGAYKYMPKLNTGNPEVRNYVLDVMDYWIRKFHIDGWRLDVADEVDEGVWEEARLLLKTRYPEIELIGETWGSGLRLMNGAQMDSIMNYVFRDAVRDFIAWETIDAEGFNSRIQKMLADYPQEMNQAMFLLLDSHDTERFLTLCGGNKDKFRLAVILQMMFVGSPSVYYGDEIGMDGENDPDCRKCMVWEEENQDLALRDLYVQLIRLRHEEAAVRIGQLITDVCDERVYVFTRIQGGEAIVTALNAGDAARNVRIPTRSAGKYMDMLRGKTYTATRISNESAGATWLGDKVNYQGELIINMNPYGATILKEVAL